MDGTRFDELTRLLGAGRSRRQVLRGLLGGAGAITVATVFEQEVGAQGCDPNANTVVCPEGSFHEGLTKKPAGQCCNGNGNCCSNVCTNNLCVDTPPPTCVPQGTECSEAVDCCEGLECIAGYCDVPQICVDEIGGDCSEIPCCDGLACSEEDDTCVDAGCQHVDEICEVDENCCGNLLCVEGYCTPPDGECADIGDWCDVSDDCCGKLICVENYCTYRLPNTGAGEGSSGSSGLLNTAIVGGAAAVVAAKVLRRKPASDGSTEA